MSSIRLHSTAEDLFLEDASRALSPASVLTLPDAVAAKPALSQQDPQYPETAAEVLRSAIESYHLGRFGNHADPGLQSLADHCASQAAEKNLPLESTITLQQVGYEQVNVKVHAYRISEARMMAQIFGDQAREYLDAAYSYGRSQAIGLDQDRWFLYIAVLTARSLTN